MVKDVTSISRHSKTHSITYGFSFLIVLALWQVLQDYNSIVDDAHPNTYTNKGKIFYIA
jgi:hypothetical protein